MGDASIQVIRENRGAAVRTIGYLKEELLRLTATESMVNTHYKISTRNINDEVSPRMRPGDAVTQYLIQLSHGEGQQCGGLVGPFLAPRPIRTL